MKPIKEKYDYNCDTMLKNHFALNNTPCVPQKVFCAILTFLCIAIALILIELS